jgi:uncharacterized protein (DUF1778 family)
MSRQTLKPKRHKAPAAKAFRFDARLNEEQKTLIEEQKTLIQKAADLEGRTMTDFVLHSAETAAELTIQKRSMLTLSAQETEAFVDAILRPAKPGPVLRMAARHYKKTSGR